jgi:hypothetical protein
MKLVDKITIDCTPNKVYSALVFFFQNTENYKLWHKDHISCYWKKGKDFSPGSVLIAKEYLHETALKLGFKILDNKPGIYFDYKVLFPSSLICSGGSFRMTPTGTKTELVAQLNFRFGFILNMLFKRIIDSLRIHMKEESIAIKGLIEKDLIKNHYA